jgi:hypothetical protein
MSLKPATSHVLVYELCGLSEDETRIARGQPCLKV